MPSHATAQHNSEIRRRQWAGEEITAADHSSMHAIPTIDNPASPAEFPLTVEEAAPQVDRFAPRSLEQREKYAADSEARHAEGNVVDSGEEISDRFAPEQVEADAIDRQVDVDDQTAPVTNAEEEEVVDGEDEEEIPDATEEEA